MVFNSIQDSLAVIYDMDGLLIDSEPLWHIAEKNVFKTVGLELTTADCLKTIGIPTREVIEYWFSLQPWKGKTLFQIEQELFLEIRNLMASQAKLMPGILDSLIYFKAKNFKIGLASASPMDLIEIAINNLGISAYFDFYHSGTLEAHNKPDPAVYLTVAKNMNVPIGNCIIFEDSINGVKGAKASGAKVVAVPDSQFYENQEYEIADLKLKSMKDVSKLFF